MISFFRKIRKKLMQQNKVRSYLRYGVGDILLVPGKSKFNNNSLELLSHLKFENAIDNRLFYDQDQLRFHMNFKEELRGIERLIEKEINDN